jgi:hypothetical protein
MSTSNSSTAEINSLLQRIQTILLQTWQETGFGHIEVDSERINSDKIRVIIRGSTHYRYVISDSEVQQWRSSLTSPLDHEGLKANEENLGNRDSHNIIHSAPVERLRGRATQKSHRPFQARGLDPTSVLFTVSP